MQFTHGAETDKTELMAQQRKETVNGLMLARALLNKGNLTAETTEEVLAIIHDAADLLIMMT